MSGPEQSLANPSHPYLSNTYQSAANPYSPAAYGGFQGASSFSPYTSMSPYSSYGGYGSPYGGGFNSMGGEHLWQGFLGQTAESLGRLNNLLSMTGMLVDHMSNHGKLLYSKGVEFHTWYQGAKNWSENHSEWMEKLGLQIESSWRTQEDEHVRRRRMLVRRTRSILILAFVVAVFFLMRKRKKVSRMQRWDAIYQYGAPRPHP